MKQQGFTVVELIIVIVVISILATIGVISYGQSRNRATKSAYDTTAQQIKLKLDEHYTDNNHYPELKSDVVSYLVGTGTGSTLVTEFGASGIGTGDQLYQYYAYADSSKTPCTGNPGSCQYYEIVIDKANWKGASGDTDMVIKP